MTTTLITGANKGLGFETARRLVAAGHTVYLGSRDAARGAEAAAAIGAKPLVIDVTSDDSVAAAAASLDALDVLINNAGIAGTSPSPAAVTTADLQAVYDVNVFGVARVLHAFLPLLEKSAAPVVVNVSSGLGSMVRVTDPHVIESTITPVVYASSKAAVNMLTVQYAKAYPAMRINSVDPGYTATDLNGHSGTQTLAEGTEAIVAMAQIGTSGPTGGFFDRSGPIPW